MYKNTFDVFNKSINTKSPTILDIACGPGNITYHLKSHNPTYNIVGIDFAPDMILIAKEKNPTSNFQVLGALDIDSLNQTFDGIVCGFLLPYLPPEHVLFLFKKVYEQLNTSGVFYVSTMDSESNYSEITTSKTEPIQSLESFYYSKDYLVDELQKLGFTILNTMHKLDGYSAPLSELFITAKK